MSRDHLAAPFPLGYVWLTWDLVLVKRMHLAKAPTPSFDSPPPRANPVPPGRSCGRDASSTGPRGSIHLGEHPPRPGGRPRCDPRRSRDQLGL
jgi:hypothetical protein